MTMLGKRGLAWSELSGWILVLIIMLVLIIIIASASGVFDLSLLRGLN